MDEDLGLGLSSPSQPHTCTGVTLTEEGTLQSPVMRHRFLEQNQIRSVTSGGAVFVMLRSVM